jgi:MazG family protein
MATTNEHDRVLAEPDPLKRLLGIMALLRRPDGCPWDREQTLRSLKPYLIEEAYEVHDAIDADDAVKLRDELGDVLLQIVFQAQIASERGWFGFADVAAAIADKLVRRHEHVFGKERAKDAGEVVERWEQVKRKEAGGDRGLLEGIPRSMPALARAARLQHKAARVGFDWPEVAGLLDKVAEEAGELAAAATPQTMGDELGDLLFALANLARRKGVDPEAALQGCNERFIRRFRYIEEKLAEAGTGIERSSLAEMDRLWNEAKARERE